MAIDKKTTKKNNTLGRLKRSVDTLCGKKTEMQKISEWYNVKDNKNKTTAKKNEKEKITQVQKLKTRIKKILGLGGRS